MQLQELIDDDLTEDEGQAVIARLSTLPDATGEQDQ